MPASGIKPGHLLLALVLTTISIIGLVLFMGFSAHAFWYLLLKGWYWFCD